MAAPILLCDTAGMTRERWLECRMHGPKGDIDYTIGGSDVAVVLGVSPWSTPLELWMIKRGLIKPDDNSNADRKEMGHLLEPIVAHWYGEKSGNEVVTDTGLYQHASIPYALANLDYRMQDKNSSKQGVLECKSTTWRNRDEWADGMVPYHYELQVRHYLATMDLEFADIACLWGNDPVQDMAIRRIMRDQEIEEQTFEQLDAFIASLRAGIPPTMTGVDPSVALKSLGRIYSQSKTSLPTIEYGAKFETKLRRIAKLQLDNSELDALTKKNNAQISALSVEIIEAMKDHASGILETASDKIIIDYPSKSRTGADTSLLKKNHPDIYDEVSKTTFSRKLRVSIEAK